MAKPRVFAEQKRDRFVEYLKRVILQSAPIAHPANVAALLASYARDARARVDVAGTTSLETIQAALEDALGLKFEGSKGRAFFRSTLIQTLFYGIFSAWVLWAKKNPPGNNALFNWHETPWELHVPMIRALFEQVGTPSKLEPLGLVEVLEWTEGALNRVDRNAFFSHFEDQRAVQYFYEPFLEAFDPQLRKDLGVWYTPPEIVKYMSRRVHAVLQEELGIEDGLADPRVYVLDPCAGTGSFLVEVLRIVRETLESKAGDALVASEVKRAALDRVFGFEILPAPFVVAHLQLGLLLQELNVPLSEQRHERAGVFLTNALTGWEPLDKEKEKAFQRVLKGFPELLEEHDHVQDVKQKVPILVVLGNPPYNAFSGVSPREEMGLVDAYKIGLIKDWSIKKFNLDDLYVRFFRLAERRIGEHTGKGIVCFISNFSYLSDPSFVVMRQRFLREFDHLWFDCLNGDSRETGKLTPESKPDPSVFSTTYNPEGIRLGTAVGLMARRATRNAKPTVRFRQFWGANKRADLLDSLQAKPFNAQYDTILPTQPSRFSMRGGTGAAHYLAWPRLVELAGVTPVSGFQEMRHSALLDIDRQALAQRMEMYFDKGIDWNALCALESGLTLDAGGFVAKDARMKLQNKTTFNAVNLLPYSLYPFDRRWCYYTDATPLWNRPRPTLFAQYWTGNRFFLTRMFAERPHENVPVTVTDALPDYHLLRPNVVAIPMRVRQASVGIAENQGALPIDETAPAPNLSVAARGYLSSLGIDPDKSTQSAELIWMHAVAVTHSPAYLAENGRDIRQDYPRIPLPNSINALEASGLLGSQVTNLLDTHQPTIGVTSGAIRAELKTIGLVTRVDRSPANPALSHLTINSGWGHWGKDRVIMPGSGHVKERGYSSVESTNNEAGAAVLNLTPLGLSALLGDTTLDIYLNDGTYWSNIPTGVWDYTIGGYQVLKKWLSYREGKILGRSISIDEARSL